MAVVVVLRHNHACVYSWLVVLSGLLHLRVVAVVLGHHQMLCVVLRGIAHRQPVGTTRVIMVVVGVAVHASKTVVVL